MARKPETTWKVQDVAFCNFLSHIDRKREKFTLSIYDLLHTSNFKGGNATIVEEEGNVAAKLNIYSESMRRISKNISNVPLGELTSTELKLLKQECASFLALTREGDTKIKGLGPSYASALLSAHFPNLIPVLDRRVLNGAEIKASHSKQGQVIKIENYYKELIQKCYNALNDDKTLTLRQLDRSWFVKPIHI